MPQTSDSFPCPLSHRCPFLNNLKEMPAVIKTTQWHYCNSNSSECAVKKVWMALGEKAIPRSLSPNLQQQADALIAQHHSAPPASSPGKNAPGWRSFPKAA